MIELKREELLQIRGGASTITGTLISALVRGMNTTLEIGRSIGSAIRRWVNKTACPI